MCVFVYVCVSNHLTKETILFLFIFKIDVFLPRWVFATVQASSGCFEQGLPGLPIAVASLVAELRPRACGLS